MSETQNQHTIDGLSRQVSIGGSRLFERSCSYPEERFFQVWQNWDYQPGRLEWRNKPSFDEKPRFGSRHGRRKPIFDIPAPDVTFAGPASRMVDFYSTGSHAFFLSDRLVALIEALDPGSLDHLPITIRCSKGEQPFHVAMPSRTLEAIDPGCTTILIADRQLGDILVRDIKFPQGVIFKNAELATVHSFADLDVPGWYWSRELIEAAKAHGIKGLRTVSPRSSDAAKADVDRL
jgi:hypothetical protein